MCFIYYKYVFMYVESVYVEKRVFMYDQENQLFFLHMNEEYKRYRCIFFYH